MTNSHGRNEKLPPNRGNNSTQNIVRLTMPHFLMRNCSTTAVSSLFFAHKEQPLSLPGVREKLRNRLHFLLSISHFSSHLGHRRGTTKTECRIDEWGGRNFRRRQRQCKSN